LVFSLIMSTII